MSDIKNRYGTDKDNPFSVPDGYFEQFPDKMMSRIMRGKKDYQPGIIRLHTSVLKVAVSAAAVLIIGIISFKLFVRNNNDNLTKEQIASVLELEFYDLDEGMNLYTSDDQEYDLIGSETADADYKDEIIQYLVDEDIAIEQIIKEL
ncbi:MAG: hypothetical protein JW894_15075 [Bacteroidales bacterium]|nr:hypothetical protein [Bacteroidales bacterium]